MIGKSEANCRKLFSRAKQKLKHDNLLQTRWTAGEKENRQLKQIASAFLEGARTGNFQQFIGSLAEDVILVTDGGGKVPAAINPIYSKRRVSAFFNGIFSRGSFNGELLPITVNGQSGVLQLKDGAPVKVVCFSLNEDQTAIRHIYIMTNPDKLKHVSRLVNN